MLNQLSAIDFRKTNMMTSWYNNNLALAPVEDAGDSAEMHTYAPATASHLSTRWVVCARSGALIMQWDEA